MLISPAYTIVESLFSGEDVVNNGLSKLPSGQRRGLTQAPSMSCT